MEEFIPEIIGGGYKVIVETTINPNIIIKRYTDPNVFYLALNR